MRGLDAVRELGARESGLAVVVTARSDGSPRASVVNAGIIEHTVTRAPVRAFVSRGTVRKLADLRARPRATPIFRSGWDWLAVEGDVELVGPDDRVDGLDDAAVLLLLRSIYAAAVGGTADAWGELDATMAQERQAAVLLHPHRIYPDAAEPSQRD